MSRHVANGGKIVTRHQSRKNQISIFAADRNQQRIDTLIIQAAGDLKVELGLPCMEDDDDLKEIYGRQFCNFPDDAKLSGWSLQCEET